MVKNIRENSCFPQPRAALPQIVTANGEVASSCTNKSSSPTLGLQKFEEGNQITTAKFEMQTDSCLFSAQENIPLSFAELRVFLTTSSSRVELKVLRPPNLQPRLQQPGSPAGAGSKHRSGVRRGAPLSRDHGKRPSVTSKPTQAPVTNLAD